MEKLVEALELKVTLTKKSLDFLSDGCNHHETYGAIHSDLFKLYNLKKQIESNAEMIRTWQRKLEVTKILKQKINDANRKTAQLEEDVSRLRLPKENPVIILTEAKPTKTEKTPPVKRETKTAVPNWPKISYLTVEEFNSVPNYMKGRLTYDAFNQAIDEFNTALDAKYSFLKRGFQAMGSIHDKKKFKEWKSHETKATRGCYFVIGDDLRLQESLKTEGSRRKIFTILRHVSRIQELRGPGAMLRYCVR